MSSNPVWTDFLRPFPGWGGGTGLSRVDTKPNNLHLKFVNPNIQIDVLNNSYAELIYTCKMIQPVIFSRFSQAVHFLRFKPGNLLLSTARFSGYNPEKYTG